MANPSLSLFASLLLAIGPAALAAGLASSPQIEFGADYYAEDYPLERVEIDATLMEEAGFRAVRLLDTNWEQMEPAAGHYNFAWLDQVLAILNRHGIRAILGTSSYVPPAWLLEKHPDFYAVTKDGGRHRWGGMGFMCLNHPAYRRHVARLVTALAARYGNHPGVLGWQVDNEPGVWGYACYDTEYCVPKFRERLKKKFGSLDELNRRWLTVSYGHRYSAWSQIPLNWTLGMQAHQAPLELEAQRFFSENVREFLQFQARILQRSNLQKWVTTNISGPSRNGNAFDWARALDFLSSSNYPRVGDHLGASFALDLMRGFNHGKPYFILEHRSGYMGPFSLTDAAPSPGLIRLWAWQTIAHGADGVLFFRWRTSLGGSEQYWQGLLDYDGTPGRAYPEVARMGGELERFGGRIAGSRTCSQVAIIMSFDSLWALHVGNAEFPYYEQISAFHHAFKRFGVNVDFVEPDADLSEYRIVVAPSLHVVSQEAAANLQRFVERGGTLVLTARSGFKDTDNLAVKQPLPGLLAPLTRASVSAYTLLEERATKTLFGFPLLTGDYQPSADNELVPVEWKGSRSYCARGWAEWLEPNGARTLFRYGKDFYAGQAAVTEAEFGAGRAFYVGTLLEPSFYLDFVRQLVRHSEVEIIESLAPGMDVAVREKNGEKIAFLLNFSPTPQTVLLPGKWRSLVSNTVASERQIPPFEMEILVSVRTD